MKKIYILTSIFIFATFFSFAQSGNNLYRKTSNKNFLTYTPEIQNSTAYFPKGYTEINPLGAPLFSEDFQGGVIPSSFKLINGDNKSPDASVSFVNDAWVVAEDFDDQTNFVAVSTSYYIPAASSDDWMITPYISIPAGITRLSWKAKSQDSSYPDGYTVKLSTTGNNKADFTNTVYSIAIENDIWTNRTIDLSAFAGQNVYIAFQNSTFDGFLLMIDDILVFQPDQYDVSISNPNVFEYPVTPLVQAFSYNNFSVLIKNTGSTLVTTPTLNIDINSGIFTDNIIGSNPLNLNDTLRLNTSLNFVPATVDSFKVVYSVSIAETETNLLDNSLKTVFVVSDSVLAREDGVNTGSLGIGTGGGVLGQTFTLNKLDTLTSVSFFLRSPNPGDIITADIYNFSGTPNSIIASTVSLNIPDTVGRWYTLKILGNGVILPANTFFIGLNETNMNVTLGTTTKFFKPNTTWVNFSTNGWETTETYNFEVAYLLRANFGKSNNFTTSINWESNFRNNEIIVSPNPTSDFLKINSNQPLKNIKLLSVSGQVLQVVNTFESTTILDIKNYSTGLYILQTESQDGLTFHKVNISR